MQGFNQSQFQNQSQVQKLSQRQIQAIKMLAMSSRDLREEIIKFAQENPALEIISDPSGSNSAKKSKMEREHSSITSDAYNSALEATEDHGETLQQHLMSQLNMMKLSPDEYSLCGNLIYNLDKNGFYGSMRAPETLLDKTRPLQNKKMLEKCLELIHNLDPVGICCKGPEESLFVQAKVLNNASNLTLFILDGNLEFLNPPEPEKILKKLEKFKIEYHQKSFAKEILLDKVKLSINEVNETLQYITSLNPRPAGDYISDTSDFEIQSPDIVLKIEKKDGTIPGDDFSTGRVYLNPGHYFQVKYASGTLPEVRISTEINFDKKLVDEAKAFIENIRFRESTIILQGCQIVKEQLAFFEKGPGNLIPLTRHQVADALGVHESTVSRTSSKHNSKYFQTEWGLFPASYFFVSGVSSTDGSEKISAEFIKAKIAEILTGGEIVKTGGVGESLKDSGNLPAAGNLKEPGKLAAAGNLKEPEKLAAAGNLKEPGNLPAAGNLKELGKPAARISDSELCRLLNEQGIKIARRTVAKYRQQAGIDNSYKR